ncbi:hypothetical protein BSKO_01455 [Bryopsis sp. KO-2023]|nr:hypothetical protein BSKO_01455 [Bryopsis sp. KO-2023]
MHSALQRHSPLIRHGGAVRARPNVASGVGFSREQVLHRDAGLKSRRRSAIFAAAPGSGMSEELKSSLDSFISKNPVILFMKGTREFPQCGFSNTTVQILNTMGVPYETVNILEDDLLRSGMKEYSQWPTFPQVYIDGEFYGGCDIMIESYQSGELKETLERVMNS